MSTFSFHFSVRSELGWGKRMLLLFPPAMNLISGEMDHEF